MNEEFNLTQLGDWNREEVDENFFNDAPEVIDGNRAEDVLDVIEKGDKGDKDNKVSKEDREFEIDWEEDNPNPDTEKAETSDKPVKRIENINSNSTISAAQLLIDKGIVDFELEEGEELDEGTALELLEEGFESGVENRIKDLLTSLPTELQALNKYVLNGGDMNDFLAKMSTIGKASGITATLNINEENNQELVVRQMYRKEGMDEDFIESQLEVLKDTGKLETFAKKRFEKWKEQDAKTSEKEVQKQEEYAKAQREKARQYYFNLKSVVNKEEFDGIKLSAKDKGEIPSYMTERNIKLNNGSVITSFNQELMEVLQNEKASIQLAKMLRDRKEDGTFDFGQIEKTAVTKVAKEVKNNLRRNKETPRKSVEVVSQLRSLADYF